jgi:hypothetical protein
LRYQQKAEAQGKTKAKGRARAIGKAKGVSKAGNEATFQAAFIPAPIP